MDVYAELSEGNELMTAIEAMPGYTPGYTNSTQYGAADGSKWQ